MQPSLIDVLLLNTQGRFFLAGFTSFLRVISSSADSLPCRELGTIGTTTPLDFVRLVDAPLALVKLVGFFRGGIRCSVVCMEA